MKDYYKILGIAHSAEDFVIKAAYRAHASKRHPDKTMDESANSQMAEINEAYACLSDPIRKASYDLNFAKFKDAQATRPASAQKDIKSNSTHTTIPSEGMGKSSIVTKIFIGAFVTAIFLIAYFAEQQNTNQHDQLAAALHRASENEMIANLKQRDFEARIDRLFPDHLDFQLKSEIEQCKKLNTNVEYTNCIEETKNLSQKKLDLYRINFGKIQDTLEFSTLTKNLFNSHENFSTEWCEEYIAYTWSGGSGTSQGVSHCKISLNAWFADLLFTSANSLKFQRFNLPPQVERSTDKPCTSQTCIDDLNLTTDHKIELIRNYIRQNGKIEYQTLSKNNISAWENSITHSNTRIIEIKRTLCTELPLAFKFEENQKSTLACEDYIEQFRNKLFTDAHQSLTQN